MGRIEITKKVEKEEWKKALDKSFEKNVKKAKIDGFRQGKAPREIYEKKMGVASLYDDALDSVVSKLYEKILEENDLKPIIMPKIDVKDISDDGVEILFTIITKPTIELKKYKNLGIKKDTASATSDEIEHEINHLKEHFAEIVLKDTPIEDKDTAVIDFEGFNDGIAFPGGKGENYPLEIGSNSFIPGFEEQLIGLKKGDEKDIKVTFPEDYYEKSLAGKEVVFKIKIHEVKTKQIPELNDDFYEDIAIPGVTNKEELDKEMEKQIISRKQTDIDVKHADKVLETIALDIKIDIPQELVDTEIDRMINDYKNRLSMQGLSLEQYLELTKSSMDKLRKDLDVEAKKSIEYRLILEEIIKLENIKATKEDTDEEVNRLSEMYGMSKEDILKNIGDIKYLEYEIEIRKALEFLKGNN